MPVTMRLECHEGCGVALLERLVFGVDAIEGAVGLNLTLNVPCQVVIAEDVGYADFEKGIHGPIAECGGRDAGEILRENFLLAEPGSADIKGGVV